MGLSHGLSHIIKLYIYIYYLYIILYILYYTNIINITSYIYIYICIHFISYIYIYICMYMYTHIYTHVFIGRFGMATSLKVPLLGTLHPLKFMDCLYVFVLDVATRALGTFVFLTHCSGSVSKLSTANNWMVDTIRTPQTN